MLEMLSEPSVTGDGAWSTWGLVDDIRSALRDALNDGPAALVTITHLEGGGPRPVGSQMVVTKFDAVGFLSGGCIESDVILRARECLDSRENTRLVYGRGSPWFDIQLLCGARIELLVEIIDPDDPAAARLFDLMDMRRPAIWQTNGLEHRCDEASGNDAVDRDWFVRRYDPQPRLIVAGSDPVSLAVAMLGIQAGFETYLFRPLGPLDPPPIKHLNYISSASHQILSDGLLDRWSYVAVCSHDQARDVEILEVALNSEAPYVGLLGSRRRLPQLDERLRQRNVAPKQLLKLRAPIGIDLGMSSQFEIAIAIMAEMISVRNAVAN